MGMRHIGQSRVRWLGRATALLIGLAAMTAPAGFSPAHSPPPDDGSHGNPKHACSGKPTQPPAQDRLLLAQLVPPVGDAGERQVTTDTNRPGARLKPEVTLWLGTGMRPQGPAPAQPGESPRGEPEPATRFGVLADIQYADKEPQGQRHYRDALDRLLKVVRQLNRDHLNFVVSLGDLIDGRGADSRSDLETVLGILSHLKAPVRHVIGNHCLEIERPALQQALRLSSPYYDWVVPGWRFVVLDGMDVSVKSPPGSPEWREARAYLQRDPRLPTYNGAIGTNQLQWLRAALTMARDNHQRVVVFCHHSLHPAASSVFDVLWNWEQVGRTLESASCVVAVFTGHAHRSGYSLQGGIHHVTLPAIVESTPGAEPFIVVEGRTDRLTLRGPGVPRQLETSP